MYVFTYICVLCLCVSVCVCVFVCTYVYIYMQPEELAAVSGRNIRKISCGNSHTMFLSDRDVFTFGSGTSGALGHGEAALEWI